MLFVGQTGFAQQCNIAVTISSDGWGDATTWELRDGSNTVVLSGGTYEDDFSDTQNYNAIDPPYTLSITIDDFGWCDNSIDYVVTVGGNPDISGTVDAVCGDVFTWNIPLNADLTACIPACPAPTGLTASVTATTADLGWTGTGDFDIKWGTSGFDVGTAGTLVTEASNPYNLGGLTTNTTYDFYVRQDCDGDFSDWVGPFSFEPSNSVSIGTGESTNMNIPVYTYFGYNASQQIVTASELGNPGTKQITKIRWYIGSNANLMSSSDNWQVYLGNTTKTDFSSNTDWILAGDMTQVFSGTVTAVNASWMEITLSSTFIYTGNNLVVTVSEVEPGYGGNYSSNTTFGSYTSASNTGIYIRNDSSPYNFANSPGTGTRTNILARLQIELSEPPSCLPPTALTASNLTYNSADLGWVSDGDTFDVKWGVSGFDVEEEGTLIEDFADGATLSGLNSNTAYQFYVRNNCGGDLSGWAGPFEFTTLCEAITALPYIENFDTYGTGSNAFPDCWERPVTYTSGSVWPSIIGVAGSSAPNSLRFQSAVGTPTYAVSPAFVEDIHNLRVKFNLRKEGSSSGSIDVGVMSNPDDLNTFELIQTINPTETTFIEYTINLNNTTLSGANNYIAFRHNSNSGSWYYG